MIFVSIGLPDWSINGAVKYIFLVRTSAHVVFLVVLMFAEAGRSSEVERSLMVRWVVGSILHGVDPFLVPASAL